MIAALFDVDGTLIARNSAPLYMQHLRRTGQARRRDVVRTLYYLARYKLGLLDIERALRASMAWISGRVEELVQRDCEEWYAREVRPYIYPAMAAAV
ncbi:MAG: haloacid dehalogenase-like hydrolase, partial [Deltaproteobacteria bacterium]